MEKGNRSVIDREKFDENFQFFDREMVAEIITLFINEQPGRFDELEKNIRENDFYSLAFNIHSLKSVLANFMAPVPLTIARMIEDHAKSENEVELPALLSDLREATNDLITELKLIRESILSQENRAGGSI